MVPYIVAFRAQLRQSVVAVLRASAFHASEMLGTLFCFGKRDVPTRRLVAAIVLLDILFIVVHVALWSMVRLDAVAENSIVRQFYISTDRGIPEIFTYLKILLILTYLARLYGLSRDPIYLSWATIFMLVLADDALRLHEQIGDLVAEASAIRTTAGLRADQAGELVAFAAVGGIALCILFLGFRRSRLPHQSIGVLMCLSLLLLAFFGVFVDALHSLAEGAVRHTSLLLGTIEDGGEMMAVSLACAIVIAACRRMTTGPGSLAAEV